MKTLREYGVPFWFAFVAFPLFILLHEVGHYVAGAYLGFKPVLHYAVVEMTIPREKDTVAAALLHSGAGPLVNAVLAIIGLGWLYALRRHRREAEVTVTDWLATTLALNAARWAEVFLSRSGQLEPRDEVYASQALGLPIWLLPAVTALLAMVAVLAAMRLHPPGQRILPFVSAGIGGGLGVALWMTVAGPFLLP